MPTGQLGTLVGSTVVLGLNIISIKPGKEEVGDIAEPHLGLAFGAGMPYSPTELVEGGTYEVEVEDDNNTQYVDTASGSSGATFKKLLRLKQTWTWTKPPATGMSTGATRAFTGYCKSVEESEQRTGNRNTIKLEIKVASTVTKVAGTA